MKKVMLVVCVISICLVMTACQKEEKQSDTRQQTNKYVITEQTESSQSSITSSSDSSQNSDQSTKDTLRTDKVSFSYDPDNPQLTIDGKEIESPHVDSDRCCEVVVGKDIQPGIYLRIFTSGMNPRSFLTAVEDKTRSEIIYDIPSYIELKAGDVFSARGMELINIDAAQKEDLSKFSNNGTPDTSLNKVTSAEGGVKPGKYLIKVAHREETYLKISTNLRDFYSNSHTFGMDNNQLPAISSDKEVDLKEGDYITLVNGELTPS